MQGFSLSLLGPFAAALDGGAIYKIHTSCVQALPD